MFPHAAISAATAIAAQRAKEEEQMTTYGNTDLDGWEFKIVRSNFGRFAKLETIQKVCREEAESGWELVEKFDQYRLRFKRRIEHRSRDKAARLDPYRTSPSSGINGQTVALVVGLVLVVIGVIMYFVLQNNPDLGGQDYNLPLILAAILVVPILFLVFKKRGR